VPCVNSLKQWFRSGSRKTKIIPPPKKKKIGKFLCVNKELGVLSGGLEASPGAWKSVTEI
jgi:hypothetical protein